MKQIYVIKARCNNEVVKICLTKKSATESLKNLGKEMFKYEVWPITLGIAFAVDANEWEG